MYIASSKIRHAKVRNRTARLRAKLKHKDRRRVARMLGK